MMSDKSYAQTYLGVIFKITLQQQGYEVSEKGRYIIAEKENKRYIIQKVCRLLSSNGLVDESSVIEVKKSVVEKLREEARKQSGQCQPAIAFGVCKYEYADAEVVIVPVEAFEGDKPAFLSETKRGYFFNYRHINGGGLEKAISRAAVRIQYDNRCRGDFYEII